MLVHLPVFPLHACGAAVPWLKRNEDLRARVLSGAVAPERLVRLDAAELATREQRERDAHLSVSETQRRGAGTPPSCMHDAKGLVLVLTGLKSVHHVCVFYSP